MANTIRIKRRASGGAGAPASLENAELAYNEVDDVLYYGKGTGGANGSASTIQAIAGSGAYVGLSGTQTITGNKTFSGTVSVPAPSANSHAATKKYVDDTVGAFTASITLAGDSGTDQTITLGDTITIAGGTGITTTTSSTDTITISIDSTVATETWVTQQGYLTSESDPVFTGSAAYNISSGNISDWNTAYGWGNHASVGYLTSESDPVFTASEAYNITSTDTSHWTSAYNWGNHASAGYLTSESDPVFTASEAYNITSTDTGNWNTAYGWGNHASAGYATGGQAVGTSDAVSFASLSTTGNVTVGGDLTVNGTVTSINSTTVTVDDKNLELASVASPTDSTANGAGITVKGATDKTWNWVSSTSAWTSSEHVDVASGKAYKVNGTTVLDGSSLGSGVTSSSLTSVGTITSGTWNGTTIAIANGGTGATSASSARTNLGLAIGTDVQAYSSTLAAVAGGSYTGSSSITTVGTISTGTWNGSTIAIANGGTGSTTASGARSALGLAIGTDVQAYSANLGALAGVTSAANALPYFTGSGTASVTTLSSFIRGLLDDADAATARTTLGVDSYTIDGGTF